MSRNREEKSMLMPNIVDSRAYGLNEKNNLKNMTENLTQNRLKVYQMNV